MSRRSYSWVTDRRTGHKGDDWRHRAACRDEDPELFFSPGDGAASRIQDEQAKKVCDRCPVQGQCLTWALANPTKAAYGVWGGTTPEERQKIRRTGRVTI